MTLARKRPPGHEPERGGAQGGRTRATAATILSGIGLLAIIGAWINGATFVGNGSNGSSFAMAMAAADPQVADARG
jgi:hypothetical protein